MRHRTFPGAVCFLFIALIASTSCNEDAQVIYPEVDPFDQVLAAYNVTVKLMNGNPGLSVSGYGDLSAVKLSVSDGILTIALTSPASAQDAVVEIIHNDLESVTGTQNSRVNFAADFTTTSPTLKVAAYNEASIYSYYKIAADTLDISVHDEAFVGFRQVEVSKNILNMGSSSLCFLEGSATDQVIDMSDGCYYNLDETNSGWPLAGPLQSDHIWVSARNGAKAWVHATTYLNAMGTTGSIIYYKGDPDTIEEQMTNGAELIQKEQ